MKEGASVCANHVLIAIHDLFTRNDVFSTRPVVELYVPLNTYTVRIVPAFHSVLGTIITWYHGTYGGSPSESS